MTFLLVEHISSGYGKSNVLQDVSFHVNEGEVVSLIGTNGAGKSTALKTVFGFLNVEKGKMVFNGKDIANKKPYEMIKLGLSFVHQGRQIFRNMAVEENLLLGAFTDKKSEKNMSRVYSMFPVLKKKSGHIASTLSGGQQQQLAIGRALMLNPKLLLLDEPSLGLDPKTVRLVFSKIKEIRSQGTTILLVEQNAKMALEISDRAYVFETGKIKLTGKGKDLLRNKSVQRLYLGG
ncbi:MAG: ABC transporter ATP-binding protein [Candidatus Aenigmarchaeota archaeon]|nr:ABC transporter ATP-binding protein [Candidatus Aenigmarchaeota archaeon]MDI6722380.1 ABC transporter ATP-binding protein [Candidatus Aenigmarchaeota archaeon]